MVTGTAHKKEEEEEQDPFLGATGIRAAEKDREVGRKSIDAIMGTADVSMLEDGKCPHPD